MTRYMYANSTRSSHVVEKQSYEFDGKQKSEGVCLCGERPRWHPTWQLSFQPTKRVCKTCQMAMDWREKVMQRKYRTLGQLYSRSGRAWSIPQGAQSTKITFEHGMFIVHFSGFGEVRFSLQHIESRPHEFEYIYDPTQPELEPLPLFKMAGDVG